MEAALVYCSYYLLVAIVFYIFAQIFDRKIIKKNKIEKKEVFFFVIVWPLTLTILMFVSFFKPEDDN